MAGYIGSKASVISSKAGFKNTFAISTTTTLLEGVTYTVNRVNVFHNGVRLVDGTDYTATNGTSITLTSAAESGDQIVVTSQADFNVANTYTQAQADATFLKPASTLDATKLSGDLPAISGANLTGIAASLSALTDCTVSTADPTGSTNPTSGVGHVWVNKTSGEQYILTDATAGLNVWTNVGDGTGAIGPLIATGGTVTTVGGYKYHTFTSSGTFQVTAAGPSVDYLVVAGGGGGGYGGPAGGGGAGGYRSGSMTPTAQSYTITVGSGGAGGSGSNTSVGSNSSALGITSTGGGYGGQSTSTSARNAGSGGSGGGGSTYAGDGSGGSGTVGQGNDGGNGSEANVSAAGGGGAGAAGQNGSSSQGGNGGDGSTWLDGTAYAGGGGATMRSGPDGNGGTGGGANHAEHAVANKGGGGGGGDGNAASRNGGNGGSGVVIIRYAV